MRCHAWMVLVVACGGNHTADFDAAPSFGASHHYVIDRQIMPRSNTEARVNGLDLDGDMTVDNQLGNGIAYITTLGLDIPAEIDRQVNTGEMITLLDLQADDLTNSAVAGFAAHDGATPMPTPCNGSTDTVCRHHLAGTGSFSIAPTSQPDTPLEGSVTAGEFLGGPGHLAMRLALLPSTASTVIHLIGARVRVSGVAVSAIASGVIAGGISQNEVDTSVIPYVQASAMTLVERDCIAPRYPPDCGCFNMSDGRTMLLVFDQSPKDCAITIDELRMNNLIVGTFAPDVMLEGVQAVSYGFGITAVAAQY